MKKVAAKTVSLYSLFVALAMMLSYLEALFPLDFIAPGIKPGFANLIPLYLILQNKKTAAISVNIIRILLTTLIFGNAFSLLFSLTAGTVSTIGMILLSRSHKFGIIGISGVGGLLHNLTQLCVAMLTVGKGVLFYTPFLIFAGIFTGVIIGILCYTLCKNNSLNKLINNV